MGCDVFCRLDRLSHRATQVAGAVGMAYITMSYKIMVY